MDRELDGESVYVIADGLGYLGMCAPAGLGAEEVTAIADEVRPAAQPWQVLGLTLGNQANPWPCDEKPGSRRHWLATR